MSSSNTREFHSKQRVTIITESGLHTGPSYVLVHGLGMGHRYWSKLADELGKTGRVYALDLPGFGDAPEPPGPLGMQESGDLLAELVTRERIDHPVLIGHSMGTQIVTETAARHPKLSEYVVLIAPTVNAAERTVAKQAARMVQDLMAASPKVILVGLVYYVKTGPRWYIKKLRTMMQHKPENSMPHITAKTLVIRGEKDKVCPRDWVRRVTTIISHARMREVAGHGHETMITGAEPVAKMIVRHVRGRL